MDMSDHRVTELFAQLGLPRDDQTIRQFIAAHSPLAGDIVLADAPFWTVSQASLLRDEISRDADWAELVDQLNAALRRASPAPV